ncbi:hypothetical protein ACIRSS_23480 [Amycolatopsis sp. NPDC101161]|uniref:hypothetical protein n=1 Tax=Amycolatopsis sp. NPDC101161 TaxID=3363940 RepID=UPI003807A5A1
MDWWLCTAGASLVPSVRPHRDGRAPGTPEPLIYRDGEERAGTSPGPICCRCRAAYLETASTVFGSFAECEQAQDVFDARLGEGRCDRAAGVQVAQRQRVGLAVSTVFEDRHVAVGGAAY